MNIELFQQIAICIAPAIIVAIISTYLFVQWQKNVYEGSYRDCERKARSNRWDRRDLRNYY